MRRRAPRSNGRPCSPRLVASAPALPQGARPRAPPAADLAAARARNQIVSEMLDLDRLGLAPPARAFPDVTGAVELAARGGVASAAELWQVRELLEVCAKLRVFARGQRESHPALSQAIDSPAELEGLEEDLVHALEADGTVADRASPELARARKRVRELRDEMKRKLGQLLERHADVVQSEYYTEREGRYVLPVRADAHLRVPGIVLGSSASGATLFVEPQEMTGPRQPAAHPGSRGAPRSRQGAHAVVGLRGQRRRARARRPARLRRADVLSALARFARQTRSIVVALSEEARLDLRTARHPLLRSRRTPWSPTTSPSKPGGRW